MKTKNLPVGIEHFEEIRRENFYYVDKTAFIITLLQNWGKANLFTRPRRFGKTLNMSMLQTFFEIGPSQKELFAGLNIVREQALCDEHMNRYPVIFLTLKSVEADDFAGALKRIKIQVANECNRLSFLAQSPKVTAKDLRTFEALLMETAVPEQLAESLRTLSRMLETHYGQKVILLIDEYDVPMNKAFLGGYYDDMISFMRVFLGEALKTNSSLKFAVITGCLRISKESIFTGVNNPRIYDITNYDHAEHFGFTDDEVRKMLSDYNLSSAYRDLRAGYNGYRFGNADIYCPWDIINHVDILTRHPQAEPESYWNNTSSNDMVKRFIDKADSATRDDIERLIAGGSVDKQIKNTLTYGELDESIDNLWSVLFLTGYLTYQHTPEKLPRGIRRLVIPNEEIKEIYMEKIQQWFAEKIKNTGREEMQALRAALLRGDCAAIEATLRKQLRGSISYYDTHENYYHGFLTGLLAGCASWNIKSNRESGAGRSDILIFPEEEAPGIVIEVKTAGTREDIPAQCEAALKQIEEKDYADAFLDYGITAVQVYGMAFYKKTCGVVGKSVTVA